MPCNSEYMNPNNSEQELSRVACLLDELKGKRWNQGQWSGYHERVYCKGLTIGSPKANKMVAELCSKLKKVDVTKYSLEMQIWWRDHQAADREREKQEARERKEAKLREKALAKLSPAEKAALGFTDGKKGA